jgi:hypothetical protein
MARVLALAATHARPNAADMLRCVLVCACALALAVAGQPLLSLQ